MNCNFKGVYVLVFEWKLKIRCSFILTLYLPLFLGGKE